MKLNTYYILNENNTIIYVFQEFSDDEALIIFKKFNAIPEAALVKLVAYVEE